MPFPPSFRPARCSSAPAGYSTGGRASKGSRQILCGPAAEYDSPPVRLLAIWPGGMAPEGLRQIVGSIVGRRQDHSPRGRGTSSLTFSFFFLF